MARKLPTVCITLLVLVICGLQTSCATTARRLLGAPAAAALPYAIVGTSEVTCYDDSKALPTCPAKGAAFDGQNAQLKSTAPSYSASELTVTDKVTGLMWMRSADLNGDGLIDHKDKLNYTAAKALPAKLNAQAYAGHSDWRLPSIKELYSLIAFTGIDPVPTSNTTAGLRPFILSPFKFQYGDMAVGERVIDAQYASSTTYVADHKKVFGVNFADGRIKGYDSEGGVNSDRILMFFVLLVRGNPDYGKNAFTDNGDSTVTDTATGLMWAKADSGVGMPWRQALSWVAARNAEGHLGYKDWRLPHIKELQSLVDYTRSPDTSGSPALAPIFEASAITNEDGQKDWGFVWSSTTHVSSDSEVTSRHASYVSFGRCLGYLTPESTGQSGQSGLRHLMHATGHNTHPAPVKLNLGPLSLQISFSKKLPVTQGTPSDAPSPQSVVAASTGSNSQSSSVSATGHYGWTDIHGAGCQRSDPKSGDPSAYPRGSGPQGDAIRINNFVRLVRTAIPTV